MTLPTFAEATTLADGHGRDRSEGTTSPAARAIVERLNPGDLEPLTHALQLWMADETEMAWWRRSYTVRFDQFIDSPTGRTRTLPGFYAWMRSHQIGPWAPAAASAVAPARRPMRIALADAEIIADALVPAGGDPVAPAVQAMRRNGRDTVEELLPELTDYLADSASVSYRERFHMIRTENLLTRGWADYPSTVTGFFAWMREQSRGPWASLLPASPRAAFPTRAALDAAALRWLRDTDPRLPRQRTQHGRFWDRGGEHEGDITDGFIIEMVRGWESDNFTDGSNFALGFWRDVRELGYGTPAFERDAAVTTGNAGSTIGPDHPGWHAWWGELERIARREGVHGYYETIARAMGYEPPARRVRYRTVVEWEGRPGEAMADIHSAFDEMFSETEMTNVTHTTTVR